MAITCWHCGGATTQADLLDGNLCPHCRERADGPPDPDEGGRVPVRYGPNGELVDHVAVDELEAASDRLWEEFDAYMRGGDE